jgi:hypothetical protein
MGSGQADGSVDVHDDREPHVTQGIEFPHRYQSSPLRRPAWLRLAGQPSRARWVRFCKHVLERFSERTRATIERLNRPECVIANHSAFVSISCLAGTSRFVPRSN